MFRVYFLSSQNPKYFTGHEKKNFKKNFFLKKKKKRTRERERLHLLVHHHMESGAVRREETDDDEDTHYIYRPRDASVAPREWSTYFPRVAYDRDDRRCGLASALIDAMCCDYNTTSRLFDEVRDDDDAFFSSKAFPNGF